MAEKYTDLARSRMAVSNNSKKSSTSTLIVVVGLIIISIVGFIWLVGKNKGTGEESEQEQTESVEQADDESSGEDEEDQQVEEAEEVEDVDVSEKALDSSAEEAPSESDFLTNDQNIGDESVDEVKITKFEQLGYEGFLRIIFTINSETDFPLSTASLQAGSNLISLRINGVVEDKSGIAPGNTADVSGSVVSTIFHEVTSEEKLAWYKIGIKAETGFYLHTLESPSRIVLDIQEQDVENGNGQEFEFSKDRQTIEGDASGNVITISGLSHSGQSDVYRIILRLGSIGTGTIPNSIAEIVDYEGGKAVKLEMQGIYNDFPSSIDYDETYANAAVRGVKCTFDSNISTYYIRINGEREYKLYYMSAPAQLIVDVKL